MAFVHFFPIIALIHLCCRYSLSRGILIFFHFVVAENHFSKKPFPLFFSFRQKPHQQMFQEFKMSSAVGTNLDNKLNTTRIFRSVCSSNYRNNWLGRHCCNIEWKVKYLFARWKVLLKYRTQGSVPVLNSINVMNLPNHYLLHKFVHSF